MAIGLSVVVVIVNQTVLSARVDKILLLSVTVVIEAPNDSDASVSMVLLLDRTTTEASILPFPSPYSLLVHTCTNVLLW